ncbi:MAG: DNA polymerase I, partial [Proteobacteria bacterium]|nr:DNA polymerase I [Pseudomonadota bacterium]
MENSKTLYLIDGSAYIHRAYHAIQSLANSKGLPTNAAFGFARMLIKLVKDKTPEYAAMFFDAKGPTFRHAIYDAYKANRPPMPEDMAAQIPYIKSITQGFNIPIFEQTGFEADDLMGSMARIAEENGFDVVMVTGDKDFIQLVTGKTTIWDPMKDETRDLQSVKTAFGVTPEQMIEVMGLSGDTADNIPGVPGIGQKTALGLIQEFGNLENLYDHIQDITKKKQKENLLTYKDQAFLSRKLATIDRSMDLPFEPDHLVLSEPDSGALSDLFRELEFRQLQQEFFAEATKREKAYHGVMDEAHLVAMIQQMEKAGSFAL